MDTIPDFAASNLPKPNLVKVMVSDALLESINAEVERRRIDRSEWIREVVVAELMRLREQDAEPGR